jgi:membrane-associated protease RseP (regulator of RpoE activity)
MAISKNKIISMKLPLLQDSKTISPTLDGTLRSDDDFILAGSAKTFTSEWTSPRIRVMEMGDSTILGVEAFGSRILFDFPKNALGLVISPDGIIKVGDKIRCPIAVKWEMHSNKRSLFVFGVKPGSVYEKSGILPGDKIIKIDNLEDKTLTIKNIRQELSRKNANYIVVERANQRKQIQIDFNKIN